MTSRDLLLTKQEKAGQKENEQTLHLYLIHYECKQIYINLICLSKTY
jgi:hypothetical protein